MAGDVAFVICDDHRGLLARRGFLEFRRALLSVDFRIFVGLPPATEVWLRYASPQVDSLIKGVDERGAGIERRRSRTVFPRCGTFVAGGSLQGVVFLEFRRALLSVDFRIFVGLPPATEVWLRYASPQVASLINGVNDRGAVIERRRSRSVFPRSGTSVAGGEHPIDHKPLPCDGIARNHKTSPCKEPPVASRTIAPARNASSRTITPARNATSRTIAPARNATSRTITPARNATSRTIACAHYTTSLYVGALRVIFARSRVCEISLLTPPRVIL